MQFDDVREQLTLGEAHEVWRADFDNSNALAAADDGTFWTDTRIAALADSIELSADVRDALIDVLPLFRAEPALRRAFWHAHHLCFVVSDGPIAPEMAPMLPQRLGAAADMFYALVFLSGVEIVRARHRAHHIPEQISIDTLRDIELWMRDYRLKHGRWGLAERWWCSTYFSGQLFKLGRLQFQMTRFNMPFVIYRRPNAGEFVALAEAGERFRVDGQFFDADDAIDPSPWTSELEENESVIRGHPAKNGTVQQQSIELHAGECELIARRGDEVLDVHIPAAGSLDPQAVSASFAQAMEFFPRHYPDFAFKSFTCLSWLLDPQLRDHLPATSNIVRFIDRFHLLPAPGANHRQTYERVLGSSDVDIERAPANTSLQFAIIAHVRAGGRWRLTGGFIPRS